MTGFHMNNSYDILDMNGIRLYIAAETSDFLSRMFLGDDRNFNIVVLNNAGAPVLTIHRSFSQKCGCTENVVTVSSSDNVIKHGEIVEEGCCKAQFSIRDAEGAVHLTIPGPPRCDMCGEVIFAVTDLTGNEIGLVHKQWQGFLVEVTNADAFGITFPLELDPKLKCLLLGAVFLIDFMFFEKRNEGLMDRHRNFSRW